MGDPKTTVVLTANELSHLIALGARGDLGDKLSRARHKLSAATRATELGLPWTVTGTTWTSGKQGGWQHKIEIPNERIGRLILWAPAAFEALSKIRSFLDSASEEAQTIASMLAASGWWEEE